MRRNIAIIGGGACGMAAAVTAAGEGACVTIYERNDRLGKKILATGNGKCNLGNRQLSAADYHSTDQALLEACLKRFGVQDTIDFFQGLGLMIKDKNGYLYPLSEQASSVLDVLRKAVEQLGIRVIYEAKVDRISPLNDGGFEISWNGGKAIHDRVILACGSKAAPKTGSDGSGYQIGKKLGFKIIPVVPALVQLKCEEPHCKAIAGVRADAEIHIRSGQEEIISERGELQLTEYGISGIPVFQLSGLVNRMMESCERSLVAEIDFLPHISEEDWQGFAVKRLEDLRCGLPTAENHHRTSMKNAKTTVEEFFTGMLNKKLMLLFIKLAGLKTNTVMESAEYDRVMEVFRLCKHFALHISGSNSFDNAQICAGGISLKEVTGELESVKWKGLYLAGEVLDVDGRCGGYNLQWAWTSGCIAGKAAAAKKDDAKIAVGKGVNGDQKKRMVIVRGKADQ